MPDHPKDLPAQVEALKRQIESLRADLARAEDLAALGTLGAMVAHEVNNLMTPIITYAQMAQDRPQDARLVEQALERSVAGANQAAKTAESILTLARPDPAPSNIACSIKAAAEQAVASVPRGTSTVTINIEPQLKAAITPASLQQILHNLLLNATRATGSGGLIILSASTRESDALISVQDNGSGVPAALRPLLFKPFATRSGYGTGLGLAICRRLANQVGGDVWLAESDAQGTRFVVRVPLACEGAAAA